MNLLVLGGTWFLGRHIVEIALERGHSLTLFNRGKTNTDLYPTIEKLQGNRDGQLGSLRGRNWDAVIDTSGFEPQQVQTAAQLLVDKVAHYTFISTIDVYKDFSKPYINETYPLDSSNEESYGSHKVKCEQVVQQLLPARALVIRPGLVVGPYDLTGRFTYWPRRLSQGGEVLAPGQPSRLVQFIDARDLAGWIVQLVEVKQTGIFNATGPANPLTMQQFLQECKTASEVNASFTWVSDEFLEEQKVSPWEEMPLWMPVKEDKYRHLGSISSTKALESGLKYRPLSKTLQDTFLWDSTLLAEIDLYRFAGLRPEREAELLGKWHKPGLSTPV